MTGGPPQTRTERLVLEWSRCVEYTHNQDSADQGERRSARVSRGSSSLRELGARVGARPGASAGAWPGRTA